MALIEQIRLIYDNYGFETKILAASVRHTMHVIECAEAGADVMTGPLSSITGLLKHPLTDIGLEKFSPTTAREMAELIRVYPENPATKTIEQAIAVLKADGIVVVPTDTVYSFACDLQSVKAMRRLSRIKGLKPKEAEFSIVFDGCAGFPNLLVPFPLRHSRR